MHKPIAYVGRFEVTYTLSAGLFMLLQRLFGKGDALLRRWAALV